MRKICYIMGCTKMKRYYILNNIAHKTKGVGEDTYFVREWYVVPTRGEPIGDNCFYRKRKWCGAEYLELSDTPTGVYICRKETLEELEKYVASEEFKNQLERTRKSDFYKMMLRTFNKAMNEYNERVKGGKK